MSRPSNISFAPADISRVAKFGLPEVSYTNPGASDVFVASVDTGGANMQRFEELLAKNNFEIESITENENTSALLHQFVAVREVMGDKTNYYLLKSELEKIGAEAVGQRQEKGRGGSTLPRLMLC